MIARANETLLLDAPVVRGPAVTRAPVRTQDLMRIVRHALKANAPKSTLDRAIRSAAQVTGTAALASEDADFHARHLARRMTAVLARRSSPPPVEPHRETVRG